MLELKVVVVGVLIALHSIAAYKPDDPGCTPSPYQVFWNQYGPVFGALDVSRWDITAGNLTQTGVDCDQPNCTAWTQGLWPTIGDNGEVFNGGVPQAANLTAHLENIRATMGGWLPDPEWAGNAVFDFEDWTPVWAQNNNPSWWHGVRYQNLSIALVGAAHPTWNSSQILAAAQEEFEAAAVAFFVQTLQLCRALRPHAAWGFYGLPASAPGPCVANGPDPSPQCGYRNPAAGPALRAENDAIAAVWAASSGIFPSIYIPAGHNTSDWFSRNADYIAGMAEEAARLASTNAPPGSQVPVRPFAWNYYHDGESLLLPADMAASINAPLPAGADGVVLWGSPTPDQNSEMTTYVNSTLGPLALEAVTTDCACAAVNCSGHGACTSPTACRCFPGYSGPRCATGA